MLVFKLFSKCKTILKVDMKTLILPQLTSLLCLYYNICTRFCLSYALEESELVTYNSSIKNVFKNSTNFTGKHLRQRLFCNKAANWRPATSLKTESGTGAFL